MRLRIGSIFALVILAVVVISVDDDVRTSGAPTLAGTQSQCTSTPEEQGMDSDILDRGLREVAAASKELHSLVVVRNDCVVIEAYRPPYNRDQKHYLNSATKVVLSALVGIAVQDRKLREGDYVWTYLSDNFPVDADPRKKRITIKDLLTMSSGISWPQFAKGKGENASDEMGKSPDWTRFILARPMASDAGSLINYSNGDSHLLSAVLQKVTGITALDFARKRLFGPLGISNVSWDNDPQGRSIGSAALQMRPIDMAKFGSLYLHDGAFEGRHILDSKWVETSLTSHVKMPTAGGAADYGYYWWLYPERNLVEAWGGAGQRIGVFRDLGLIIVITADMPQDTPRSPFAVRLHDVIRESVKSSHPLPANPSAVSELKRSVGELILH